MADKQVDEVGEGGQAFAGLGAEADDASQRQTVQLANSSASWEGCNVPISASRFIERARQRNPDGAGTP